MNVEEQKGAEREVGKQSIPAIAEEISTLREKLASQCPEICADLPPLSFPRNENGQYLEDDILRRTVMGDILTYLQSVHAHVQHALEELRRAGLGEEEIRKVKAEAEARHAALQQSEDRKRKLTRQLRDRSIPAANARAFVQYLSGEHRIHEQQKDELRQLETWLRETGALRMELLSAAVGNGSVAAILAEHMQRIPTQNANEAEEAGAKNGKQRVKRGQRRKRKGHAMNKKGERSRTEEGTYFLLYNLSEQEISNMEQRVRHLFLRPLGQLFDTALIEDFAEFRKNYNGCHPREGDYLFRFEEGAFVCHPSSFGAPVMVFPRRKLAPGEFERSFHNIEALSATPQGKEVIVQDPVAPSPMSGYRG